MIVHFQGLYPYDETELTISMCVARNNKIHIKDVDVYEIMR